MNDLFNTPLTEAVFYWLSERYPYLGICDINTQMVSDNPPDVSVTPLGWTIMDYENAMFFGASYLHLTHHFESIKQRLTGKIIPSKRARAMSGTPLMQAFNLCKILLETAQTRQWPGVRIIGGFYPVKRFLYILCQNDKIQVDGFTPSPEDQVVHDWFKDIHQGSFLKQSQ
jgi:hypothetical protein